jgi:hypothetical protein
MNIEVTKKNEYKNEIVKIPSTNQWKIKTYTYYFFFSDSGRDGRRV